MQALELQASVKDGILQIPELPTPLADGDVKLIVLYEEPSGRNYDPEKLKAALLKVQEMNPFRNIEDPVEWQRKQRDEWE